MDTTCSVFIATSLNGFIARPDGDVDWLHNPAYALPDESDFGYTPFITTVDAIVMGRHSFEKVLTFGQWPYKDTPVVVLTSRSLNVPEHLHSTVTVAGGTPQTIVDELAETGKHHLYIDGGTTIQRFLQAGCIHRLTITQIPILLDDGIPLFGAIGRDVHLRLVTSKHWANGFVQSTYEARYT